MDGGWCVTCQVQNSPAQVCWCCSHRRLQRCPMVQDRVRCSRSNRRLNHRKVLRDTQDTFRCNCPRRLEMQGCNSNTSSPGIEQWRRRSLDMCRDISHWSDIYCVLQGGQRLNMGSRRACSRALHTSAGVRARVLGGTVGLHEVVCECRGTYAQESQPNGCKSEGQHVV